MQDERLTRGPGRLTQEGLQEWLNDLRGWTVRVEVVVEYKDSSRKVFEAEGVLQPTSNAPVDASPDIKKLLRWYAVGEARLDLNLPYGNDAGHYGLAVRGDAAWVGLAENVTLWIVAPSDATFRREAAAN